MGVAVLLLEPSPVHSKSIETGLKLWIPDLSIVLFEDTISCKHYLQNGIAVDGAILDCNVGCEVAVELAGLGIPFVYYTSSPDAAGIAKGRLVARGSRNRTRTGIDKANRF